MSNIPSELRYSTTHEWAKLDDEGNIVIGITDHAQALLGDLVFIEFPELESTLRTGDECVVIESVKAASDVYAPVGGDVIAINEALADKPELVNQSPYVDGWLFKLKPLDEEQLADLLDAESYAEVIEEEV